MTEALVAILAVLVVLLVKTNNLQRRVTRLEMDVQRFMLRVIYGADDNAD